MALITKVVDTKDFHTLEKMRVDDSYFLVTETKEVYRYLRSVYFAPDTRGDVPSRAMIALHYPGFFWLDSQDSVGVLATELRHEKIRLELLSLATELENNASLDPVGMLATLRTRSSSLSALAEVGSDLSMAGCADMLRNQYDTVANAGGVIGIPYPWTALNEETQGMQGGQFLVLYGRPKSMKTWIAVDMAVHAYMHSRCRVMFYTREMSPQMICQRVAARIAKVDYKKFKNGQLQPAIRDHAFSIFQDLAEAETSAGKYGYNQPCFIIVSDRSAGGSGGGVGWLQSRIRDLKPDVVFVDGMYLMKDDRSNQRSVDWKQIAHISQDLKLTAQEYNIPLIGVTQANRAAQKTNGDDLTELAFSDSLGQDADGVFRVTKKDVVDENTKIKRTEIYLTAPGLREGTFDGIVLNAHPAVSFDFLRIITNLDEAKGTEYTPSRGGPGSGGGAARSSFRRSEANPPIISPRT